MANDYVEGYAVVTLLGYDLDAVEPQETGQNLPARLTMAKVLWDESEAEAEAVRLNSRCAQRRRASPADSQPVHYVHDGHYSAGVEPHGDLGPWPPDGWVDDRPGDD